MKKLKLDLDALEVDTFDPALPEDAAGTVLGEQIGVTAWFSCGRASCVTCNLSCRPTCGASCFVSCAGTCLRTCGHLSCGPTCQFTCVATCVTCGQTCIPQLCGGPSVFEICP